MASKAKAPDDGEAARGRVRDLVEKAFGMNALGHDARARLDKEALKRDAAVVNVGPSVPAQKESPERAGSGDGGEGGADVRRAGEVNRQKAMVGEVSHQAVRRAKRLRLSRAAQEDVSQDAVARMLGRIDREPLVLDDDPQAARRQMVGYLEWAVLSAYKDHLAKVATRSATLAEYTAKIEMPKSAEIGQSAEDVFFSAEDQAMAAALTDGFTASMDDAVREAERLATAMHDLVGTKELLALIMHKAFAVPSDLVAEMIDSSKDGVRMACGAAAPKLRKAPARRTFLNRLGRADTD